MVSSQIQSTSRILLSGWFGHRNFGDELSPYLIEKLTGTKPIISTDFGNSCLCAIGSLVQWSALITDTFFWGSGILDEEFAADLVGLKPYKPHINRCFALRGPLTAMMLFNNCGWFKLSKVFADPAILMPYVYQAKRSSQRYELGIICHHTQDTSDLESIVSNQYSSKVKVISIFREGNDQLEQCCDEICSCDRIASASLHGIIVAQAYGIPAMFIQNIQQPISNHSCFKFNDYFLGTKQKPQAPFKFHDWVDLINKLLNMAFVTPPKFRDLGQNLLDVFPRQDQLKLQELPY